jgi:Kazal-type serine protease inhibitor domain
MAKFRVLLRVALVLAIAVFSCVLLAPQCPEVCTTNDDCDDDFFCSKLNSQCDGDGVCQPKPEGCTEAPSPICGCDGETYLNRCYAAMAGTTVENRGVCPD